MRLATKHELGGGAPCAAQLADVGGEREELANLGATQVALIARQAARTVCGSIEGEHERVSRGELARALAVVLGSEGDGHGRRLKVDRIAGEGVSSDGVGGDGEPPMIDGDEWRLWG